MTACYHSFSNSQLNFALFYRHLKARLALGWRIRLTQHLLKNYLRNNAFYKVLVPKCIVDSFGISILQEPLLGWHWSVSIKAICFTTFSLLKLLYLRTKNCFFPDDMGKILFWKLCAAFFNLASFTFMICDWLSNSLHLFNLWINCHRYN